jgi:hypothetical protein
MKRILTSIALVASISTAQAAGPEDVLLGIILGGVLGNAIAKQPVQPPVIVQQPQPQIIYQQPQIIYQPLPPQPQCYHTPIYNGYGQFFGWRTICR